MKTLKSIIIEITLVALLLSGVALCYYWPFNRGAKVEFPDSDIQSMQVCISFDKPSMNEERKTLTATQIEALTDIFRKLKKTYATIEDEPEIILFYYLNNDQEEHATSIFLKEKLVYHAYFLDAFHDRMIGRISYCCKLNDRQIKEILQILNHGEEDIP